VKKLLFLASGRGSNFEAIAKAIHEGTLTDVQPVGLISNVADAPVLQIAKRFHVPTTVLSKDMFRDSRGKWNRPGYELALGESIAAHAPDWIVLAGYLLLLGAETVNRWNGQIVNIHPSLLPAFRGLHAQKQALEAGVCWTGCTVHLVTEGLDEGPILEQTPLEILPEDTEESLSRRLLVTEHETYVRALARLCHTPFHLNGNRVVWAQTAYKK
jgi:phosphoribosylglycinamide formyltransferase-1